MDLMAETPESYARRLASYIASPTKIEALTRMEFGRAPSLRWIANERYLIEQRRKPMNTYYKDNPAHDGHDFVVRSLLPPLRPPVARKPSAKLPKKVVLRPRLPAPTDLISAVASEFDYSLADIMGKGRSRALARCRQTIYSILRFQGFSYNQIALWMGRDHSTVIYGCDHFDDYSQQHPLMREVFDKFTALEAVEEREAA